MLAPIIQLTLALEIVLVCCEGTIPIASRYLPLGRSHLAQLGFLLGSAVGSMEIWDAISRLIHP